MEKHHKNDVHMVFEYHWTRFVLTAIGKVLTDYGVDTIEEFSDNFFLTLPVSHVVCMLYQVYHLETMKGWILDQSVLIVIISPWINVLVT